LPPLLSPEEEQWFGQLADAGTPVTPAGDDLLFAPGGGLRARTRYELRLIDVARPGRPLLSVGFVSWRFSGFTESLGRDSGWPDRPLTVPAAAVAGIDRSAVRAAAVAAAAARYQEGYVAERRLRGAATLAELDAARRLRVGRDAALDAALTDLGRAFGLTERLVADPSLPPRADRAARSSARASLKSAAPRAPRWTRACPGSARRGRARCPAARQRRTPHIGADTRAGFPRGNQDGATPCRDAPAAAA
jgi:hypothetical protein